MSLTPVRVPPKTFPPGINAGGGLKLMISRFSYAPWISFPGINAGGGLKHGRRFCLGFPLRVSPGINAGGGSKHREGAAPKATRLAVSPGINAGGGSETSPSKPVSDQTKSFPRHQRRGIWKRRPKTSRYGGNLFPPASTPGADLNRRPLYRRVSGSILSPGINAGGGLKLAHSEVAREGLEFTPASTPGAD